MSLCGTATLHLASIFTTDLLITGGTCLYLYQKRGKETWYDLCPSNSRNSCVTGKLRTAYLIKSCWSSFNPRCPQPSLRLFLLSLTKLFHSTICCASFPSHVFLDDRLKVSVFSRNVTFAIALAKLYVVSVLFTLNSRGTIRREYESGQENSLNTFRTSRGVGGTSATIVSSEFLFIELVLT